ncbi:heme-binding protein [Kiritimatiellota bacterium B12222]|nr:heme-binding protein [Kiritimatiellota bacterium B12222]
MKTQTPLLTLLAIFPFTLPAYEQSMTQTPKGTIEVKTLPAMTAIEAREDGNYFEKDNKMFRKLFRYISDKDISMTTPVIVDVDPGAMRFLISEPEIKKADESTESVQIIPLPEQSVVSIGYNGKYSQKNYDRHLAQLESWLTENEAEWIVVGEPIAVYWDGPFKLSAWKQAEVMIPIQKRSDASLTVEPPTQSGKP